MKRLLYIAFKDLSNPYLGGNTKVRAQCRAFAELGMDVELIGRFGSSTVMLQNDRIIQTLSQLQSLMQNTRLRSLVDKHYEVNDLIRYLKNKTYDACYIRYDFSDPDFIRLLSVVRPCCGKVFMELPTYPYEQENQYGVASRLRMTLDRIYRKRLHTYIDQIITFYGDYAELFGIPVLTIPNGFDYSSMALASSEPEREEIHVAAVSSMREWHGYERAIEGLYRYYRNKTAETRNFVLHLVGGGRLLEYYRSLVRERNMEQHVIFDGPLHGEALDKLYERCLLGIDSLARHRSNIHVLSSLKSREYAAKGIPIINSCKIDVIEADFPYFLQVPADETPLDWNSIATFFDRCYPAGCPRQEIGQKIRSYMEVKTGMQATMKPIAERLLQID